MPAKVSPRNVWWMYIVHTSFYVDDKKKDIYTREV